MRYTLERGKRYGAWIQLSGIQTWATDGMVEQKFEEFGFSKIEMEARDDEDRIVIWGTWNKANMTGEMPDSVMYVEEAPT